MRTILFLIQKEFLQIRRNKSMLPMIFVIPIVQLIVLVHAATFEIKNIRLYIVDNDLSTASRLLESKFGGSPFFIVAGNSFSYREAEKQMMNDKADVILQIPQNFEKNLMTRNPAKLQLVINAINGTAGGLANAYASNVIADFSRQMNAIIPAAEITTAPKNVQLTFSHWFNPELNYKTFMVPGILSLLVTIIAFILSGMNVVREKEIGTIEQINVTPIKKYQFIIGKLFPFWVIGLFELAFGLLIGKLLFHIPIVGSLGLVFLSAMVYMLVILGLGLFVSTVTNTQQQAMLISFFFMMIFILMSGLFTAVENMPSWAQTLDKGNPVAYFIRIMRMILLKGSGFAEIRNDLMILLGMGLGVLGLAVWRYRKTV